MPKLLKNIRETILQSAKDALLLCGYDALTMRDVAKSCGIAVGTLYNYFTSKDMLVAAVMLEDWQSALARMRAGCLCAGGVGEGLSSMYDSLAQFYELYRGVWAGYTCSSGARTAFSARHNLLVRQLAEIVVALFLRFGTEASREEGTFFAENILICAGDSEMTFDAFLHIVRRLYTKSETMN